MASIGFSPSYNIDSKDKEYVTDTISSFSHRFNLSKNSRYNRITLISARIPKSYYTAQSAHGNLSFVLVEDVLSTIITIPEGNYNVNSFSYVLTNLLNNQSPNGFTYSMSFPNSYIEPQTFKYTFSVTGNAFQPSFLFTSKSFRIIEFLGFKSEGTFPFVSNSLISQRSVKFQHTSYITLRTSMSESRDSVDTDSSILARINVSDVPDGGDIIYEIQDGRDAERVLSNTSSNLYDFQLYDDNNRLLELSHNWSCVILLSEANRTDEFLINDIQLRHVNSLQDEAILSAPSALETSTPFIDSKIALKAEKKQEKI